MTKIISLTIVIAILFWIVDLNLAHAQSTQCFTNGPYINCQNFDNGVNITGMLQNQRNTEAIINEMRAQRHQPPCSMGLLGQWQGRPRCP